MIKGWRTVLNEPDFLFLEFSFFNTWGGIKKGSWMRLCSEWRRLFQQRHLRILSGVSPVTYIHTLGIQIPQGSIQQSALTGGETKELQHLCFPLLKAGKKMGLSLWPTNRTEQTNDGSRPTRPCYAITKHVGLNNFP